MDPTRLLEIQDLHISFESFNKKIDAVRGLSFSVKKGETLGIVGESGSGKSVTSLAIMRLLPEDGNIDRGAIHFRRKNGNTVDLTQLTDNDHRQVRGSEIAMIFQDPMNSLNPVMRCGDQVMESVLLHEQLNGKNARERVISLFQKVRLDDAERIFRSYPHQLSGGQRQRIMIAMALSCNPALLIADEPTSSLDVTVQRSILDLFQDLKKEWDGTILFISHDLGVVSEVADRVLVLRGGEKMEEGPTQLVLTRPVHSYTRELLSDYRGQETSTPVAPGKSREPVLEIQDLRTWFTTGTKKPGQTSGYVKAVDGISLQVFRGETLGLVGESGSGKTTLGRTLLFLQQPTNGKILYNGQELQELPDNQWKSFRKDMQIIFQDPYASLDPRQSIGQAIMEPMEVHGLHGNREARQEKVIELLLTVGLEADHFQRFPHEFSGGQRQRICIARALALEPKFIVCDECVSALDVTVQARIIALLKALQKAKGLTYIFISHDLSVVRRISNRIAVMKDGKIVEMDQTETVFRNPQADYTKKLLSAIPGLHSFGS